MEYKVFMEIALIIYAERNTVFHARSSSWLLYKTHVIASCHWPTPYIDQFAWQQRGIYLRCNNCVWRIGPDEIPKEVYTIHSQYWYGGHPKGIYLRIRRWHILTEVPIDADKATFTNRLNERWIEKNRMLQRFHATGSLVTDTTLEERQTETVVRSTRVRSYCRELIPHILIISFYYWVGRTLWELLSVFLYF